MADFDDVFSGVNAPRMTAKRMKSGMVPVAHASASELAEMAAAAEFLGIVAKRAEDRTGDPEARAIREAADEVAASCRAKAANR